MRYQRHLSTFLMLLILFSSMNLAVLVQSQSASLKVVDAYWTVKDKRVTSARVGDEVVAHIKVKAQGGTVQGTLTIKVMQDLAFSPDEEYVSHQVSIVLTSGIEKEYNLTFVPFHASGEELKEVLGEPELRGYYIEVEFNDDTIYTMKSEYPPRLTVPPPFWAICIADATVDNSDPDANRGFKSYLEVSDSEYWLLSLYRDIERSYLKFDISGLPEKAIIKSAFLIMYTWTVDETHRIGAHFCPDNSWQENTITWNNAPHFDKKILDQVLVAKESTWYGWNVTEAFNKVQFPQEISFTLISEDKHGFLEDVWFHSKDSESSWQEGYGPKLAIYWSLLTSISCNVYPESISFGEEVTITGQISPPVGGADVKIIITAPDASKRTVMGKTDSEGTFKITFTPDDVGIWEVSASWEGNAEYEGAVSPEISFTVVKASTSISIKTSESRVVKGNLITVSGTIDPAIPRAKVTLVFTRPDGSTFTKTVTTTADGSFSGFIQPDMPGVWILKASWKGDPHFEGSSSQEISFTVIELISTTISCSVSPDTISFGDHVKVSGSISPSVSGKIVTLTYTRPNGSTLTRTVGTDVNGAYSDYYTPTEVGYWSVKASWEGDEEHRGAVSSAVSFLVTKASTSISIQSSTSKITKGELITISGSISPSVSGAKVTITYTKPDGSIFTRTVFTGADGSYSDSYTPTEKGEWSVKASWEGDAYYEGASSSSVSFTVEAKRCIIATATYGSELSPEVQFLRGFRDNMVLNTFAGRCFMTVFNAWYYSFSPTVASVIASHELLRNIMKILLYPLIGILHLSAVTFSLLRFNAEFAIVVSGLVASSLIGITYFTPATLILCIIKRMKITLRVIQIQLAIWTISIGCIAIAEIVKWTELMMISTAMLVLSTISLVTSFSLKYLKISLFNISTNSNRNNAIK